MQERVNLVLVWARNIIRSSSTSTKNTTIPASFFLFEPFDKFNSAGMLVLLLVLMLFSDDASSFLVLLSATVPNTVATKFQCYRDQGRDHQTARRKFYSRTAHRHRQPRCTAIDLLWTIVHREAPNLYWWWYGLSSEVLACVPFTHSVCVCVFGFQCSCSFFILSFSHLPTARASGSIFELCQWSRPEALRLQWLPHGAFYLFYFWFAICVCLISQSFITTLQTPNFIL